MKKFLILGSILVLAFIVISDPAQAGGNYTLTINSSSFSSGMRLVLSGTATANPYAGNLGQPQVLINWGDSKTAGEWVTITSSGRSSNKYYIGTWASEHSYLSPGTYLVTVRLYDNLVKAGGESATVSQSFVITSL